MVSLAAPHGNNDRKQRWQLHPRQSLGLYPAVHVFQHSGSTERDQKCNQTPLEVAWPDGHSHTVDTWSCNKQSIFFKKKDQILYMSFMTLLSAITT